MAEKDIKLVVVEIDGVDVDEGEEYLLHSEDAEFTDGGFTATKAQAAIVEAKEGFPTKAGRVLSGAFAGNPKTAAVTFGTAFANTNYTIEITGVDNRDWSYSSKTSGGFTINANANQALTGEVSWQAEFDGEHG